MTPNAQTHKNEVLESMNILIVQEDFMVQSDLPNRLEDENNSKTDFKNRKASICDEVQMFSNKLELSDNFSAPSS